MMRVINVFSNGSSVIWFDTLRCSIVVIGIGGNNYILKWKYCEGSVFV